MPIEPPPKPPPLPGEKDAEEYRRAQDQFHLVLGYCIAKWAEVQDELFLICWTALRSGPEPAAVVFFRTPTLDARLSLTDELVRLILPKTLPGKQPHQDLETWTAAVAAVRALLPIRNRLAHHPVQGEMLYVYFDDDPEQQEQLFTEFRSTISDAELLRGRHTESDRHLINDDLQLHLEKTSALRMRLRAFWSDVLLGHVSKLPPPSRPYHSG